MIVQSPLMPLPVGLLILGFGGHARAVADVALSMGIRHLAFEEYQARAGECFHGFEVVQCWDIPLPDGWAAFGAAGNGEDREAQHGRISAFGWPLATLVAPSASLGVDCQLGPGSMVGHQAHVGPLARIGTGCIINSGAVVDHESVIGDFTHVSVNTTVAGRCSIGSHVTLGAGAVVIDKVSISDGIVVGAGAVVTRPLVRKGTYVGVPARHLIGDRSE